jgi:transposase-like protein
MVRPGRERLSGLVEVDEAYWGGEEEGVDGRQLEEKALLLVAAEADGKGIGRIRLATAPDTSKKSLHGFIQQVVEPGSTVRTGGYNHYLGLEGYLHDRQMQKGQPEGVHVLPRVHRVISLLKRWLLGTHQGAVSREQLDHYLDEFTFRFNRRKSAWRGKLFYRLLQHAVQVEPTPYRALIKPQDIAGG